MVAEICIAPVQGCYSRAIWHGSTSTALDEYSNSQSKPRGTSATPKGSRSTARGIDGGHSS